MEWVTMRWALGKGWGGKTTSARPFFVIETESTI